MSKKSGPPPLMSKAGAAAAHEHDHVHDEDEVGFEFPAEVKPLLEEAKRQMRGTKLPVTLLSGFLGGMPFGLYLWRVLTVYSWQDNIVEPHFD